ncbi:MAG: hypothetical protein ACI4C7_01185, partial [Clostridia bacterium]
IAYACEEFYPCRYYFFEVMYTKWYKPKCNRILRKCNYATLKMAYLSEKFNIDFLEITILPKRYF